MNLKQKVILLMMVLAVAVVIGGCTVSTVSAGSSVARVGPHSCYILRLFPVFRPHTKCTAKDT